VIKVCQPKDPVAAGLRGFGPLGVLSILFIVAGNFLVVPLSAILVLLWARRSHTPWGIPTKGLAGVEQATVVGLVFGAIFAATGRIWMLMFAHAAFDLIAIAIIYWNLESTVAHLVFK